MGEGVLDPIYTQQDLQRYREKIQRCLDALARMLAGDSFSAGPEQMGLELELNLIDKNVDPAMANQTVLKQINDPAFQTELGQHNIEINVAPRPLAADEALGLERELRAALNTANDAARNTGVGLVMIGILPTLRADHFDRRWMSPTSRYALLNTQILAARREELELNMEGVPLEGCLPERLRCAADSILPESGCTSVQLHLQVAPRDFAAHWNAAQALAGVQVALAANSPFLLGRALWHETRIPLFEQSTDTRSPELRNQGVRPRVWFGERWITSIFDLFEENARYFSPLLPQTEDEDPLAVLAEGGAPSLSELRLHNSTIWRWNRPVYDVAAGVPHLRIENRVLPAGPTVIDVLANAAFFFGAMRGLTELDRPVWSQMSFQAAEDNLYAGARLGMDAQLYWPGNGWVRPDELVLRKLLPLAHDGLRSCGMSDAARERYLAVIEQRCVTRRNGASWQRATVQALAAQGADRPAALAGMLRRYLEHMHSNQPVHAWPSA
ncbi:MAG TPA: glutamate-cysteine ligase family protein [Pseudonocardiaceae bacterium]|nr:glutamate-cysteine ligase family protein [Pseudonocardiaceae bacterium]